MSASAIAAAFRKSLKSLNDKYPGILKYLVNEPRFFDIEKPKHLRHPDEAQVMEKEHIPDNAPPPELRDRMMTRLEEESVSDQTDFSYYKRNSRDAQNTPFVAIQLDAKTIANNDNSLAESLFDLHENVLKSHSVKEDDPYFAFSTSELRHELRTSGRPHITHPYTKPDPGQPNRAEELIRFHSDDLDRQLLEEQHNK
mmetsp:Transcript_22348/g.33293  ORF Transcript_22348/g.33293 Transcript_22348/m.33293 type:complete len:198 (-) Transcript_22348:111-704(-)|eukprot:CAMPEP_0201552716 /NCGR_PEP_ID=MMETSP0173_2-20130828/17029_1 /ASSEMBLY_ACC=CAM_ASM_000268 /TAXON_ID=218659 /ORGANISM="Vexillifera sp., Strain DIVA3 564/2" /LENGTH=197 /DNA_ID=CAMNT_0047963241 /DNA_START=58 /DNA_END=651 /DNA_ORIENTATION=+